MNAKETDEYWDRIRKELMKCTKEQLVQSIMDMSHTTTPVHLLMESE